MSRSLVQEFGGEIDPVLGAGEWSPGGDDAAIVRGHRHSRYCRLDLGPVPVHPLRDLHPVTGAERVDDRGDRGQVESVAVVGRRAVEHLRTVLGPAVPTHHELDQGPVRPRTLGWAIRMGISLTR